MIIRSSNRATEFGLSPSKWRALSETKAPFRFAVFVKPARLFSGRENPRDLATNYIEPERWEKPNALVIERHEYYELLKPTQIEKVKFDSIHTLARWYRITATIAPDGEAAVIWKLRKDR